MLAQSSALPGFEPNLTDSITGEASSAAAQMAVETRVLSDEPTALQTLQIKAKDIWDRKWAILQDTLSDIAAVAYRRGVSYLAQKLAYDTAVWIGSGAKGQGPLYITQGWQDYLGEAGDVASGLIFDDLIKKGWLAAGLCAPDFQVQLAIKSSFGQFIPPRPRCTFSRIRQNWDRAIEDADFLMEYSNSYAPGESSLSAALILNTNLVSETQSKIWRDTFSRLEAGGFSPSTDIGGNIKLPGSAVAEALNGTLDFSLRQRDFPTGKIIADTVDTFAGTLVSTFLQNLMKCGLSCDSSSKNRRSGSLLDPNQSDAIEGISGAQVRLSRDLNQTFKPGGTYDILSKISQCSDANNPSPNGCAINNNMATAIEQHLTVQQAIDKGLFPANQPFGFLVSGQRTAEPTLNGGIPYRSILIMRKYRIVPVGWELAARHIQQFGLEQKTLRDLVGLYNESSSPYYHLVDPNWVLAAPEAYCNLQGPGPQIASQQISEGLDANSDGDFDDSGDRKPSIKVTRQDYCADEQTCLKVDDTGKCLNWGYCTEEKRVWNFGGNACKPEFNTCTSVDNRTNGSTASYLLSTVDFGTAPYECDAASAGCKQYSRERNVLQTDGTKADAWQSGLYPDTVHLTAKAPDCGPEDTGCHAYVRTGLNLPTDDLAGINLVSNGSFEVNTSNGALTGWHGGQTNGVSSQNATQGTTATPAGDGDYYYKPPVSLLLTQELLLARPIPGDKPVFTISFLARSSSGGTLDGRVGFSNSFTAPPVGFSSMTAVFTEHPVLNSTWQRYVGTITIPTTITASAFNLAFNITTSHEIDRIKLELGDRTTTTAYSTYGQKPDGSTPFVHLKRAPDYYGCRSTNNALNDPSEPEQSQCQPFARHCLAEEVGCLGYTPQTGGAQITSVRGDVCPAQCVGYDVYTQSKTFFEGPKFQELIPSTARRCSAAQAGCDEFTNLDTEARGGEAREYYQQVRYCQKETNGSAPFYSWEGSDTTGYQLRVFTLKETSVTAADADGAGTAYTEAQHGDAAKAPCTNINWTALDQAPACTDHLPDTNGNLKLLSTICSADIARTNPDCRQFYDVNGSISYRLYSKTVSVTDNCQPYRKTESSRIDCEASSGLWDATINACFYQAVPTEGRRCSANAASCREYRGGTTADYRVLLTDNFETGSSGWNGGALSSVASLVGGHSYKITTAEAIKDLTATLGSSISGGGVEKSNYVLSLTARSQTGSSHGLIAQLVDSNNKSVTLLAATNLTPEWQTFTGDPQSLSALSALTGGTNPTITLHITSDKPECQADLNNDGSLTVADVTLATSWAANAGGLCPAGITRWPCDGGVLITEVTKLISAVQDPSHCSGPAEFYMDNIQLKSNTNTYYLIKNSWNTPSACTVGTKKMLGCQNYRVSDGATRSIYSFGQACSPKVIGCEALIDTKNTTIGDDASQIKNFAGGSALGGVTIPADTIDYLVNDPAKRCNGKFQGCEALGVPVRQTLASNSPITGWQPQPVYKLNNPDRYEGNYLCNAAQRECAEYKDSNGTLLYFKDPGQNVCEYRTDKPKVGWYRRASTANSPDCQALCANNAPANAGKACTSSTDCGGATCVPAPARTNSPGGVAEPADPQFGLVASCALAEDSCREFLDPRSDDGRNLIENGNFIDISGWKVSTNNEPFGGSYPAGVVSGGPVDGKLHINFGSVYQDTISVNAKTDYIISLEARGDGQDRFAYAQLVCGTTKFPNAPYRFLPDGTNLERFSQQISVDASYSNCKLFIGNYPGPDSGIQVSKVSLREAQYHYQLGKLIDRGSCNGFVNNADCVLVNEQGNNLDKLGVRSSIYDADLSPLTTSAAPYTAIRGEYTCNTTTNVCDQDSSISCSSHKDCQLNYDANTIVKVRPDRACAAWLATRDSQIVKDSNGQDKRISLAVGNCEEADSANLARCIRWSVDRGPSNLTFSKATVDQLKNLSGFSKVGFNWSDGTIEGNLSPSHMEQVENFADVPNGSFEQATATGNPIGWLGWNDGRNFKVISDPITAQRAGVRYPRDGRRLLEVNANTDVATLSTLARNVTNPISVAGGQDYVLSADIQTQRFAGNFVGILVAQFRADDTEISAERKVIATLTPGRDWERVTGIVETDTEATSVRFQLIWQSAGSASGDGIWFIDNIQLGRALELKTNNAAFASQSCRLYPKDDSLLCRYTDDEGLRQRGKLGYCLEFDPQHPETCLQWWPVDNVIGEGLNDPVGYADRVPLFICAEAETKLENPNSNDPAKVPYRVDTRDHRINAGTLNAISIKDNIGGTETWASKFTQSIVTAQQEAIGYPGAICLGPAVDLSTGGKDENPWCKPSHHFPYCRRTFCLTPQDALTPNDRDVYWAPADIIDTMNATDRSALQAVRLTDADALPDVDDSTYQVWSLHKAMVREGYDAGLVTQSGNRFEFWVIFDRATGKIVRFTHFTLDDGNNTRDFTFPDGIRILTSYCKKVLQVVGPNGENGAWSKRVSSKSNYVTVPSVMSYDSDFSPFGAAVPPPPVDDPSAWDSRSTQFQQPLYMELPDSTLTSPYQARAGGAYSCKLPANITAGLACLTPNGRPISATNPMCLELYDPVKRRFTGTCTNTATICSTDVECAGQLGHCANNAAITCSTINGGDTACGAVVPGPTSGTCAHDDTTSCDVSLNAPASGEDSTVVNEACFDPATPLEPEYPCLPTNYCEPSSCNISKTCFAPGTIDHKKICTVDTDCGAPSAVGNRTYYDTDSSGNDGAYESLNRLFVRSYGLWEWIGDELRGQYKPVSNSASSPALKPPTQVCTSLTRPAPTGTEKLKTLPTLAPANNDYCGIYPNITSVKLSPSLLTGTGEVTLEIQAKVDAEQEPITEIIIDWGDGKKTRQAGLKIQSRISDDTALKFTHIYNIRDMVACRANGTCPNQLPCNGNVACFANPRIRIVDNWGWCNGGDATTGTNGSACASLNTSTSHWKTVYAPNQLYGVGVLFK